MAARKLTNDIIRTIQDRVADGATYADLARDLKLSVGTVSNAMKVKLPRRRKRAKPSAESPPPSAPASDAPTVAPPGTTASLLEDLAGLKSQLRDDLKKTKEPTMRARYSKLLVVLLQCEKQLLPKEDEKDVITLKESELGAAARRAKKRLHDYVEHVASKVARV